MDFTPPPLRQALAAGRVGMLDLHVAEVGWIGNAKKPIFVDHIRFLVRHESIVVGERAMPVRRYLSGKSAQWDPQPLELHCATGWTVQIVVCSAVRAKPSGIKRTWFTAVQHLLVSSSAITDHHVDCLCRHLPVGLLVRVSAQFSPAHEALLFLKSKIPRAPSFPSAFCAEMRSTIVSQENIFGEEGAKHLISALDIIDHDVEAYLSFVRARSEPQCTPNDTPLTEEAEALKYHEMAIMLHAVLAKLHSAAPEGPRVSINLVEKLLAVAHCSDCIDAVGISSPSAERQLSSTSEEAKGIIGTRLTEASLYNGSTAWALRISAELWYVQRALLACSFAVGASASASVVGVDHVGLREISLVMETFFTYDAFASGNILSPDLPLLLEDLHVPLTGSEVSALRDTMDPDQVGLIAVHSFLSWWCS